MKSFFLFLLTFSSFAFASQYAVVVNSRSEIKQLSSKEIQDIFMMKRHFIESQKITPVNISASQAIRTEFEKNVLSVSREKLNNYWVKQHFHGVRPPIVQSSLNSVKLFIKNVDGSIGYLPLSHIDEDLKVIFEF
jgi:ABC-type phosphate transport system substrate-binding protein